MASKFVYGCRDPGNPDFRWVALTWRNRHTGVWNRLGMRGAAPWLAVDIACRRVWRKDRTYHPWWFRRFQKDLPDAQP